MSEDRKKTNIKIYTCTPVAFVADESFFIRDSGLICNELIKMGVESKSVMPLPYREGDYGENLIRTEMKNLKSPKWWASLGIDGVVLYSWGLPKYLGVALAIKKAGLRLVIHMDSAGRFDKIPKGDSSRLKAIVKYMCTSFFNPFRVWHLRSADVITMAPPAAESIGEMLFFSRFVVRRNFPMPCPVSSICRFDGRRKKNVVMCVGRWDDESQKRTSYLLRTIENYYKKGGDAEIRVYGKLTKGVREWYSRMPESIKSRVVLGGYISNSKLHEEFQESKIVLCPSSHESSHIVSAEGLCCGCSIVVTNRPEPLRCVHWYTTRQSGTISKEDTPESLADALIDELNEWEKGNRCPDKISSSWIPHFHVDKVMGAIFGDLLNKS